MSKATQVIEQAEEILQEEKRIADISFPAVREVFEHVAQYHNGPMAYNKHSDHSKSNTKGCPLGCIGG